MTAPSSSADHTFKVSSNIGFWCEGKWIQLYDGLFIVMNEIGVVLSWELCKGTAFHKVEDQLITGNLKDGLRAPLFVTSTSITAVSRGKKLNFVFHEIVSKLRLALQHKYQLAIQQTAEVGELLCVTMKMDREEGQDNSQDDSLCRL
ncbi:hypothetical protein ACROYT_G014595 [Oculina patagonica]